MDNSDPNVSKSVAIYCICFGLFFDLTNYLSQTIQQFWNIESAHVKTFEWIFQPSVLDGSKTVPFAQWLREGSGTFWIQGKASSGKSTLMKFICSHTRTEVFLRDFFFFWSSGTVLQKSREGLLRSLLFEILRKCPELIPRVSKDNPKAQFWKRSPHSYADDEELWSREELMEVYHKLVACCDEVNVKFCFFIDGLDEFEEVSKAHSDLIATLRILDASQNIKFCVYVLKKFNENRQFQLLSTDNPHYASLIRDITHRAKGVFLWVVPVVRDFLEGSLHNDTTCTMRKRLEGPPTELEQLLQ
ncbi:hypothetical protein F4803DRAFT_565429 [Xylaria telfairii]|nr:hypothetical protein F4803DRAFT_565429 [Xylaria telfairii]